jgi:hypothetical protein
VLEALLATRVLDQDAAHRFGSREEEVTLSIPLLIGLLRQA